MCHSQLYNVRIMGGIMNFVKWEGKIICCVWAHIDDIDRFLLEPSTFITAQISVPTTRALGAPYLSSFIWGYHSYVMHLLNISLALSTFITSLVFERQKTWKIIQSLNYTLRSRVIEVIHQRSHGRIRWKTPAC